MNYSMLKGLLLAAVFFFSACGNGGDGEHHHEETAPAAEAMGPEYTSAYVCPMHCEGSGSAEPGTCPVCGMDYVARADHEANGHSHE